jgi:hypothetical protein
MKKKQKPVVMLCREVDGTVVTEVRPDKCNPVNSLVIDRAKGPILTVDVMRQRAKRLAELTGLEYLENLQMRCQLERKLPCCCPECREAGRW